MEGERIKRRTIQKPAPRSIFGKTNQQNGNGEKETGDSPRLGGERVSLSSAAESKKKRTGREKEGKLQPHLSI